MAAFDVDAALRWFRFNPRGSLSRRSDDELPFLESIVGGGPALFLDTCVYIDQLQGRTPQVVEELIEARQVNHSTVAVQELMHAVGALAPNDRRTSGTIGRIRALIRSMPSHRVFAPDPDVLGRAAILAGLLCRLQGYTADGKMRALMDATLFLQGQKLGLVVLTRNVRDFDILLQLMPSDRARFYRISE